MFQDFSGLQTQSLTPASRETGRFLPYVRFINEGRVPWIHPGVTLTMPTLSRTTACFCLVSFFCVVSHLSGSELMCETLNGLNELICCEHISPQVSE